MNTFCLSKTEKTISFMGLSLYWSFYQGDLIINMLPGIDKTEVQLVFCIVFVAFTVFAFKNSHVLHSLKYNHPQVLVIASVLMGICYYMTSVTSFRKYIIEFNIWLVASVFVLSTIGWSLFCTSLKNQLSLPCFFLFVVFSFISYFILTTVCIKLDLHQNMLPFEVVLSAVCAYYLFRCLSGKNKVSPAENRTDSIPDSQKSINSTENIAGSSGGSGEVFKEDDAFYRKNDLENTDFNRINNRCLELGKEYGLTEREIAVLELLSQGYTNQQIADEMSITINTIKTHIRGIYSKTGCHSKQEIIRIVKA